MSMKRIVFIIFFGVSGLDCFAQPVIVAGAKNQNIVIGRMLSVLLDTSGKLSYADVSSSTFQNNFKQSDQDIPDFGAEPSPVWCRFSIKNSY